MPFKSKSLLRLLGFAAVAVSVAVMSADHAESPGADADPAADLADIFFFPSPETPATKMVGAITFGGRPAPRSRIDQSFYCDPNVLYILNIDRADAAGDFDDVADVRIVVRLATNGAGACGVQFENIPGAGGTFSGPIESVFTSPTGLKGFAGLRNDPFFFDAQGYSALVASFAAAGQSGDVAVAFGLGTRPRRDSFADRNVSAAVFEMDLNTLAPLTGGVRPRIRLWGTTARLAG